MFQKVLVAVDHSDITQDVFERAIALAQATQAIVMVLHVLSTEEEGSPKMPVFSGMSLYPGWDARLLELCREQWDAFESAGVALLRSLTDQAIEMGIRTEFTQLSGSPGRAICDLARTWGADLILMGRRGHAGLQELVLGSVSNYVLHHAPCSVLVVHRADDASSNTIPRLTRTDITEENAPIVSV